MNEGRTITDGLCCGDCRFWSANECRRRGPMMVLTSSRIAVVRSRFPPMAKENPGCGELEPHPAPGIDVGTVNLTEEID